MKRRAFEPTGTFDRALYALLALVGPRSAISVFTLDNGEHAFAAAILGIWSLIAAFYTIEFVIHSYRDFRRWELFCDWCNRVRQKDPCESCKRQTKIVCVRCGHRAKEKHECRTVTIPPTFPLEQKR